MKAYDEGMLLFDILTFDDLGVTQSQGQGQKYHFKCLGI